MDNQPTALDKAVKISVITGALIVGLSVAYYLVVYIPQRDRTKIEQQIQLRQTNADNLTSCLNSENDARNRNMQGLFEQSKNVQLPVGQDNLDRVEKIYQERKVDCFKKYPQ